MNNTNVLEQLLCFSLYSLTNGLTRQYRSLLQNVDLTYPQFIVLIALYEKDNISLKQLSEKTRFDSGSLTPIVQKLEKKLLLKRVPISEDERVKKVILMPKAIDLKDKILDLPNQMRCTIKMSDEELALLQKLSKNLLEDLYNPNPV